MRAWTRGEKIGFWSMIVGVVTCVAVVSSLPPVRRLVSGGGVEGVSSEAAEAVATTDRGMLLEQQRKLLGEQAASIREEVQRLNEARVQARKERIEMIAERYRAGKTREYDRILLTNNCNFRVGVVIHYLDLDETWITRGWWEIDPGKTLTTDALNRGRYLYFYAENKSVGRTWTGEGKAGAKTLTISDSKFDAVAGERFLYPEPYSVDFFQRDTGEEWKDHTEVFECPVEAPPG